MDCYLKKKKCQYSGIPYRKDTDSIFNTHAEQRPWFKYTHSTHTQTCLLFHNLYVSGWPWVHKISKKCSPGTLIVFKMKSYQWECEKNLGNESKRFFFVDTIMSKLTADSILTLD